MVEIWEEEEEKKEKCIICSREIFNYPFTWDPICFDCWKGYTFRKKNIRT